VEEEKEVEPAVDSVMAAVSCDVVAGFARSEVGNDQSGSGWPREPGRALSGGGLSTRGGGLEGTGGVYEEGGGGG
jgi:hypothetical protein